MKARQIDILHQIARAQCAHAADSVALSAVVAAGDAWEWVVVQTVDELVALCLAVTEHGGNTGRKYVRLTPEGRALLI